MPGPGLITATMLLTGAAALTLTTASAAATPAPPGAGSVHTAVSRARAELGDARFTASARTTIRGITMSVPSHVTTYNNHAAKIRPTAAVGRNSAQRVIGTTIAAYASHRRVAHGRAVRLRPGRYTQRITVTYSTYRYITRHRITTVQVRHPGGTPAGTDCLITAVLDSSGAGAMDTIDTAACTNAAYPGQEVDVTGDTLTDVTQGDGATNYAVGQHVTTGTTNFAAFYTTETRSVPYSVKVYTRHSLLTRRASLVIKDGGHLQIWSGSESGRTSYFTVPRRWQLVYAYDCGGYEGNWITILHKAHTPSYDDNTLTNDIDYSGSDGFRFTGAGKFRVHVITECAWAIGVHWR